MSWLPPKPLWAHLKRRGWLVAGALLVGLAMSVQLWLTSLFNWPQALLHTAVDLGPWLLSLPVIIRLARRYPLQGPRRVRHAAVHLFLCLVFSLALPLCALGLLRLSGADFRPGAPPLPPPGMRSASPPPGYPTDTLPRPPPQPPPLWRIASMRAPLHWAIYGLLLALIHGWTLARRAREHEEHSAQLEKLLLEARLSSLTRQLQPHFLFNTLNTIASLLRQNPAQAESLLLDLSEFLRRTLRISDRHVIALHEELALLDLYLDIQLARFGSRLHLVKKIDPETLGAQVPVLILQPLVENALRHGLDATFGDVHVTIETALAADGRLRLSVQDDGNPGSSATRPGAGIGLQNTRDRLEALHGDAAIISAGPLPGRGWITECLLPLQTAPDPEAAGGHTP